MNWLTDFDFFSVRRLCQQKKLFSYAISEFVRRFQPVRVRPATRKHIVPYQNITSDTEDCLHNFIFVVRNEIFVVGKPQSFFFFLNFTRHLSWLM